MTNQDAPPICRGCGREAPEGLAGWRVATTTLSHLVLDPSAVEPVTKVVTELLCSTCGERAEAVLAGRRGDLH